MTIEYEDGEILICIDNECYEEVLTIGGEYPVGDVWYHQGEYHPRIIIDGETNGFLKQRFKKKEKTLPELEPTMYREEIIPGTDNRLHVIDAKEYDQILLIMEHRSNDFVVSASHLKLDADDALDLAHDLVRMAMQLKRRTK